MKVMIVGMAMVLAAAAVCQAQNTAACQQLSLWPLPSNCTLGPRQDYLLHPAIQITSDTDNDVLNQAMQRYAGYFSLKFVHRQRGPLEPHIGDVNDSFVAPESNTFSHSPADGGGVLFAVTVTVDHPEIDSEYKTLDTDESYEVVAKTPTATVRAATIWGAIYGLETLSQLIYYDTTRQALYMRGGSIVISDAPRFPHRGLMIDTANHFLTKELIIDTLDAMSFHKLNVLHWHIVDSYSFPLEVRQRPELHQSGAWLENDGPSYSEADIDAVVEYARLRGIRVIPEIDVPGHAYSWGLSNPSLTVACPTNVSAFTDIGPINVVPLDPTNNETYIAFSQVLQTVTDKFPDTYLHLGGDEVQQVCWTSNANISAWMKAHHISDGTELERYFFQRISPLVSAKNRRVLFWDEAYTTLNPALPKFANDSKPVIQIWDNSSLLSEVLEAGYDAIFSGGFYLDRQAPVDSAVIHWFWLDTWADMYRVDLGPAQDQPKADGAGRLLGGEACMWSEQVSDVSFHTRVWPRAAAAAERLWSPASANNASAAAQRLGVARCRFAARGIQIGPIWADYCSHDTSVAFAATKLESGDKRTHLTSGELLAILLFIYILGLLTVYLAGCCFGCYLPGMVRASKRGAPLSSESTASNVPATSSSDGGADAKAKNGAGASAAHSAALGAAGTSAPIVLTATSTTPASPTKPDAVVRDDGDVVPSGGAGSVQGEEEAVPLLPRSQAAGQPANGASKNPQELQAEQPNSALRTHVPISERLSSLDVFRGFTVALMVFVDDTGASFPEIHHSPWNGIRLADFVMPFFDFIVGVSIAASFKKFELEGQSAHRWPAFRKATVRFVKLFMIGVLTQGGINFMQYDLSHIRVMGILQRVALCYYATALMEIFLPRLKAHRDYNHSFSWSARMSDTLHMFWRYRYHWIVALLLFLTHTAIMYGVDVPDAFGEKCGRGKLTPPCNAATYIDKHIFTVAHMYFPENGGDPANADVTFMRLPECSSCSPGFCRPPDNAPAWCFHGPFDPEGLVSSLNAIITTVIGLHYGHVLRRVNRPNARMWHWASFGVFQLALGLILHFSGAFLMNTDLYSISYTLVTGGTAGLLLTFCYFVIDIRRRGAFFWRGFMYLGMNAITMYLCAEGGIIEYFLSCFYLGDQDKNLQNILYPTGVYWGEDDTVDGGPTYSYQLMLWTIAFIGLWMFVARWMYQRRIFITI